MIQMLFHHFCKVPLGSQNDKLLELEKNFQVYYPFLSISEEVEGKLPEPHRQLRRGLGLKSPEFPLIVHFLCGPIDRTLWK